MSTTFFFKASEFLSSLRAPIFFLLLEENLQHTLIQMFWMSLGKISCPHAPAVQVITDLFGDPLAYCGELPTPGLSLAEVKSECGHHPLMCQWTRRNAVRDLVCLATEQVCSIWKWTRFNSCQAIKRYNFTSYSIVRVEIIEKEKETYWGGFLSSFL